MEGWISRGNMTCPVCHNTTDVNTLKKQFREKTTSERMLAVIWDGDRGKEYQLPTLKEREIIYKVGEIKLYRPVENMQRNSAGGDTFSWGVNKWGQMFSNRQLLAMQTFVEEL